MTSSSSSAGGTGGGTGGAACVPVDDGNPCTDDVCAGGVPMSTPTAAGSPCSMGGTQCDGLGACVTPACTGALGFLEAPTLSAGTLPDSVAAADLDGDGKPDLTVANTGHVSVLLNQGNGTFAPAVYLPSGMYPIAITAVDLNGDAEPDLAVANKFSGTVSVLLNATCLP